ncbi:Pleiotropic drug resistance protein 2 [Datura stramonium]|uniref:Pleiotropic drug resistance protein 2 n=1 Tax=Datura stramonium TaxID=4076 RepID=A0ABS8VNU4_DATST|nr:Pleiotropic drug resistance protein 2 [Datura stramonium]
MDEPTSGLDARAAAIVMRTVRKTVDTGRTVVCTIHQPSIDIFEADEAIRGVPKIRECDNPATWMLDVSSSSVEAKLDIDFAEVYAKSDLYHNHWILFGVIFGIKGIKYTDNKICLICLELLMQLSCFLEPQMLLQYNLLWLLKEQFSIAKELLKWSRVEPYDLLRWL